MSDHYELLGVAPTASASEIRQAYLRLARDKHPDRYLDPAEKQRAQRLFQDITTAFNTLLNPRSRQEYDESRAKPQPRTPAEIAADALERGQAAFAEGRLEDALVLLRTAVYHAPNEAPGHAALGRALAGFPQAGREAVQSLERAAQLAPGNAAVLVDLAAALAAQGLRLRAQKTLEAARRLAPRDPRVVKLAGELGLA